MSRRYAFRAGVVLERSAPFGTVLVAKGHRVCLDGMPAAAADAAAELLRTGCTLRDLTDATGLSPDAVGGAIRRVDRLGLIRHAAVAGGKTLLSLDPMAGRPFGLSCRPHRSDRDARDGRVVLSRFAYSRCHEGRLVLESPLSHFRATLHTPEAAGLLAVLAGGAGAAGTGGDPGGTGRTAGPASALHGCVTLLVHAGLAVPAGEQDEPDPENGKLAGWSFHDLLFHSRSRPGMHDYPLGRTYPLRGRVAPLPGVPPRRGERRPLPRAGPCPDPPFAAVLERRRSVRVHGDEPITLAALGGFLDRCARIRRSVAADPAAGIPYESSVRPYPSGGGAYDLEIYVVANHCTGLDRGVYHYAADAHALERVAPVDRRVETLLADAARFGALRGEPHVLLLLTARFARLSWKYSGMAYAMTLKNVGVLYQTMYLVATAMNLAPCALGTGNPALLARVLDVPFAEESSVGEFLLGVE